jgi:hypothetical protein
VIRVDVLDMYVFEERTDLIDHPCVQCLDMWEIDEDLATPSDHAVIVFSWEQL